jgi:proline dehydrogenase
VSSTSPSGCQTQGVQVNKAESKYANATTPENILMALGNMQTKVIYNAILYLLIGGTIRGTTLILKN